MVCSGCHTSAFNSFYSSLPIVRNACSDSETTSFILI